MVQFSHPTARWIELEAADGFLLGGYLCVPRDPPLGGIVVLQEILGVNRHIRGIVDQFASLGYLTLAPALFDRVRRGVDMGYSADELAEGRRLRGGLDYPTMLRDVRAAIAVAREAGRVGAIGYCLGGSLAYALAAESGSVDAVAGYYGGDIPGMAERRPTVPTMLHFAEGDRHIPLEQVERVRLAQPAVEIFLYPGRHGFNCDERDTYQPESARIARERTQSFFAAHLDSRGAYVPVVPSTKASAV